MRTMEVTEEIRFRARQGAKSFLQNVVLQSEYERWRDRAVDPHRVIFADAHHDHRPESMDRLVEAMEGTEFYAREIYCDFGGLTARQQLRVSFDFMRLYAQAGTVVLCDNFLPASSCRKKPETRVIQLWHGPGAFKKFGYDAEEDIPPYYRGNVYRNYSLVTVSGPACVAPFRSAMRQPEGVVRPLGISRMDRCFEPGYREACRQEFEEAYPQARGKKVLLWAPTFRGNAGNPRLVGLESIERLGRQLGDRWVVIPSVHPHLVRHLNREDLRAKMPTERIIPEADVFITDYSSVMYDACLFHRKMLLFAPDLPEFLAERGCYLNLREFPGEIVTDGADLAGAVLRTEENYDFQKQEEFRKAYLSACDGHATDRILACIRSQRGR